MHTLYLLCWNSPIISLCDWYHLTLSSQSPISNTSTQTHEEQKIITISEKTHNTVWSLNKLHRTTKSFSFFLCSCFPTRFTCSALHFAFWNIHARKPHPTRVSSFFCFMPTTTTTQTLAHHQPSSVHHSVMTPFPPQNQTRHTLFFFLFSYIFFCSSCFLKLKKHKQNHNLEFFFFLKKNYIWIMWLCFCDSWVTILQRNCLVWRNSSQGLNLFLLFYLIFSYFVIKI